MSRAGDEPPEHRGDSAAGGRAGGAKGDGAATGRKARSPSAKPRAAIPSGAGALKARPGYEVGYAKPPEATRFQKGTSGNPRGRPKGRKNLVPALNEERMKAIILEEAYRTITVRDGTRNVSVPIARAVLRSLAVSAVKGQHRSQRLFAELLSAVETSRRALHDEWLNTAMQYKVDWDIELHRRRVLGITHLPDPLPHPDHIRIDLQEGTARVIGPSTREEKGEFDQAYGELRRQVILRELCKDALVTEEDFEERDELAHCIEVATTTIARCRTLLPEDLYPVKIDDELRAEMRALQRKWALIIAAETAAEGGMDAEANPKDDL